MKMLILSNGDIHFLQTVKTLNASDIQRDMESLSQNQFFKKHDWPQNSSGYDLFYELKEQHSIK